MKKKIILTKDLQMNAIMVVDIKTNNVFHSSDQNMSIANYILLAHFRTLTQGFSELPNILGYELEYVGDGSGITSKGYKYKASGYKMQNANILIFVNIIEGVETEIGTQIYEMA